MSSLARPAVRGLRHRAFAYILLTVLLAGAIALLGAPFLALSTLAPWKTLTVLVVGAGVVLAGLPSHHPFPKLGIANQITLARGALIALLAGFVGEASSARIEMAVLVTAIIAASLDSLDGRVARRTGMSSAFGARLDMETDAALILILSVLAWQFDKAGAWVLLAGLLRYLFVTASMFLAWLRQPLPPSFRRKTIAALQMAGLIVTLTPFIPPPFSSAAAAVTLALLGYSFLIDIVWLKKL